MQSPVARRSSPITRNSYKAGAWETGLRGGTTRRRDDGGKPSQDVQRTDANEMARRALFSPRRESSRAYRQLASTFTIRLVSESEDAFKSDNVRGRRVMKMNSSHTQSRDAVVRAVSENKLEYKEFPSWNDDNAAPGFDLEFVADKVIPQNLKEDSKRNIFAETFDPAVQHFTKGGNASVLILHWDPSAVLVACQGVFQNIELVRALQLDFDGSCSPGQGVTLSWVELNGAFGIRDALAEAVSAGRNSQRPSSASADDRPRIEDGGGALLNVLEVRLGDINEALQLVERMSQVDRSGRPSHRVLTVKRGEARLQLVFADSREPLELQHFNSVLEALEAQRPAVPFHTSRIANLLRGALLDREAFVVMGSVGCRPEPSGVSGASENLAHKSVELRVADPDRAIAVLGIMSRLQQFCGVRVHEIEQDLCNNQEIEIDAFTGDHDIAHVQRLHGSSTCELFAASEPEKELDHLNPAMAVSGLEAFEAEARRIEEKLWDTDMPIEEQSTRVLGLLEHQVAEGMVAEEYQFAAQEAARWIKAAVRRLDDNGAALDTLQDTNEFLSAENQGLVESTTRLEEELAQRKKELARVNDELSESRTALEKAKAPSTQALQHDTISQPGSSSVSPKPRSLSKKGHVMAQSQDGASVQDFALYRHVMETTVLRIQEELNTAIQERDAAQESCRKIETKARKDHRAAQEQRKYVKEVSEKLTALFHESQAQKQDLNDLREAHEKLIARQKRERYELEALRKQRYGLQVERDALAKEMETLTQNLKAGFEREKHALQRKLVETKAQLDKALADAVVYRAAPRNHAPRQIPAASDAPSEDTGMSDIVSLLRERKKAMLASAESSGALDVATSNEEGATTQSRTRLDRRAFTESLLAGLKARKLQRGSLSHSGLGRCEGVGNNDKERATKAIGEEDQKEEEEEEEEKASRLSQKQNIYHRKAASTAVSQPKTGKSSRPQARVRRENGSVAVPELRMADLNTSKRHRVKSDRTSEPFVRRRPPFPHEKPPWKIAGA